MSKYFLTDRDAFLTTLNESSISEGVFKDALNALARKAVQKITHIASGKDADDDALDLFNDYMKSYMKTIYSAVGQQKMQIGSKDGETPIQVSYKGETINQTAAKFRETSETIIKLLKDFYFLKAISQKELKAKITEQLKIVGDIVEIIKDEDYNSFDYIVTNYNTGLFHMEDLDIYRVHYDNKMKRFREYIKGELKTNFTNYFEDKLNEKIYKELLFDDEGRPTGFLIYTGDQLAEFLRIAMKHNYLGPIVFPRKTDNIESIQKAFLLNYTKAISTQVTKVSSEFLEYLIELIGTIDKIALTSDDYHLSNYEDDAEMIMQALLNVKELRISSKKARNLGSDLRTIVYLNALVFLVNNYKARSSGKNGVFHIDDWGKGQSDYAKNNGEKGRTNLTDFYRFIFVKHKAFFDDYFSDVGTKFKTENVKTNSFYLNAGDKKSKIFRKYFVKLAEHIGETPAKPLKITSDGDVEEQQVEFDEYNMDHYSNEDVLHSNFSKLDSSQPVKNFVLINIGPTHGQKTVKHLEHLRAIKHDLDINLTLKAVELLTLRDRYFSDYEGYDVSDIKKRKALAKQKDIKDDMFAALLNIIYILYYSIKLLKQTDLNTTEKRFKIIQFYLEVINKGANIKAIDHYKSISTHVTNHIERENNKIISHFAELIDDVKSRDLAIKDFISKNNIKTIISRSEIDDFFTIKKELFDDEYISFESFNSMVTLKFDYGRAVAVFRDALSNSKSAFSKSITAIDIDIKVSKNRIKDLYDIGMAIANTLIDDLSYNLGKGKLMAMRKLNIVYNLPIVYASFVEVSKENKVFKTSKGVEKISYVNLKNRIKFLGSAMYLKQMTYTDILDALNIKLKNSKIHKKK